MEQKQLDEIDESYFGDEFIDDKEVKFDNLKEEEVKIEPAVEDKSKKKATTLKKVKAAKEGKVGEKKEGNQEEKKFDLLKEDKKEVTKEVKKEESKFKVSAEIKEGAPRVDPWGKKEEKSSSSETSTWKAVAGVSIILLIFSVFTQGFNFGASGFSLTGSTVGASISLSEAEKTVLSYVNTRLLQPPFLAEVVQVSEAGNLYKVSLSIAGEDVDSYLTKDGKLFFPQGFAVTESVKLPDKEESGADPTGVEAIGGEPVAPDTAEKIPTTEPTVTETSGSEKTSEVVETTVKEVSLVAKKWLFTPNRIIVSKGNRVKLTVESSGLDFTFALPDLGVEKDVSGSATIEFTANKVGEFTFSCGSCEEWRGMVGTLVVK